MFGHGWATGYGVILTEDPATGKVAGDQEDGSQVAFTPSGTGGFSPVQPRILARLTERSDGSYVYTRRARDVLTFDSTGKLVALADLNGETTTLGYDSNGHLASATDAAGRVENFTTDSAGRITRAVDSAGHAYVYAYSTAGDLTSVTDPTTSSWTFTYDADHRLLTMLNPNQQAAAHPTPLTNIYDSSGRVSSQTDFAGWTTSFDYTTISGATKVTDPAGHVTVDAYSNGLRMSSTAGYGTSDATTTNYTYDPATEAIASVTDGRHNTSRYTYDARGNTLTKTDPLNRVMTSTYDTLNDLLTRTSPVGVTTTMSYDSRGNLKTVSTPLLSASGDITATQSTTYTHGDATHPGDVTAVTGPTGNVISDAFDAYGDLLSVTAPATPENPDGNRVSYTYDPATGWRLTATAPKGNLPGATAATFTTSYGYDPDGRPTYVRDSLWTSVRPSLHQSIVSYDPDGNTLSSTDKNGHTTSFAYDADDELITKTLPDGTSSQQSWTPDGQLSTATDPAGHVTTHIYNALGEETTTADPLRRTTSFAYDADGNLTLRAAPGATCTGATPTSGCTSFTYDADNELTAVRYLDGATHAISFGYDADGRRVSMSDGTGTSSYTYDSLGRLTSTTDGTGATTAYGFDLVGNKTSINYPGNHTVTRSFAAANRLSLVTDWLGHTTTYAYDANSNTTSTSLPTATGETDTTGYDQLDHVTSITDAQNSSTLASFNYTRDSAGQVTSETDASTGNPAQTYTYSSLNQLVTSGTPASPTSYAYDAGENITNRGTIDASDASTQSFDAGNQLCWSSTSTVSNPECASTPTGATAYSYNTSGDRTTATSPNGGRSTYGYDEADQLTTSTSAALASVDNFVPLTPARAVDTRIGTGAPKSQLAPNASITYHATGSNGIPTTGVTAVAFNLTAVGPAGTGVVRVAPAGSSNTLTPLNYYSGQGITGMVISQVGTGGAVTITNYGGTIDVVIDVVGYYTTASTASTGDGFVPVTPARALDTRDGTGNVTVSALAANQSVTYQAGGHNGIPATGVSSVVFNMTAVNPSGTGVVRVAAAGSGSTSTPINYYTGQGITGLVVVPVSSGGAVTITNYGGTINLVVDIVGYYTTPGTASAGNGFVPVTPARALDTRTGTGLPSAGSLAPNQSVTYHAAGNNGVPATGVTAVVFNMTAVGPSGTGVVRVAPGGTSSYIVPINYYTGQGITGMVITKLGADGTVTILNAGGTINIAVDLVGYYTAENTASTSSYTHDGEGLRTSKTTDGATRTFTWDINAALPLLESDTTNTCIYGADDLPLEQIHNTTGAVSYLHHDQLGSTRILTNTTGSITTTQNYDPYGKPTLSTGTPSPLGYTGQYTDTDTGFLYLRARYYDPATAQFLTIDPLLGITGQAYSYADTNPVNSTDPTGQAGNAEERGEAPGADPTIFYAMGSEGTGFVDTEGEAGASGVTDDPVDCPLEAAAEAMKDAALDTTPKGRQYSAHYLNETGPLRNIPGSVLTRPLIGDVVKDLQDRSVYYDPKNDVTVVESKTTGKIMSVRRGA